EALAAVARIPADAAQAELAHLPVERLVDPPEMVELARARHELRLHELPDRVAEGEMLRAAVDVLACGHGPTSRAVVAHRAPGSNDPAGRPNDRTSRPRCAGTIRTRCEGTPSVCYRAAIQGRRFPLACKLESRKRRARRTSCRSGSRVSTSASSVTTPSKGASQRLPKTTGAKPRRPPIW